MDIDIEPLLDTPPPANSSERTKQELLEVKSFMEKDHPEEFKSQLKKMDEDKEARILNSYFNCIYFHFKYHSYYTILYLH